MDGMDALAAVLAAKGDAGASSALPPFGTDCSTLAGLLAGAPAGATVLDVGCAGWRMPAMAAEAGRPDLAHVGADLFGEPPGRPASAGFLPIPSDGAAFCKDAADLVVSSHCLEHSSDPVASFGALAEACRPGGLIYVECPSELSAARVASDDPMDHAFLSFWDDPTHVRPWTPGALYRLAIGHGAVPLRCGRLVRWGIPCSAIVCRAGKSVAYRYVSFKDVEPGIDAAMAAIWGDRGLEEHPK